MREPLQDAGVGFQLLPLLPLPRLGFIAQLKEVWVPLLHLRDDRVGDVLGSKRAGLFTQHDLECHVQEDVAELLFDRVGIAGGERVIQLEDLFNQIRAQRRSGLLAIPRAAVSQVTHQFYDTSKRRWFLPLRHCAGTIPAD